MRCRPKILMATGGTGGHIYPAIALAEELEDLGMECMFAGGKLSQNRYFNKSFLHADIPVGRGLKESFSILKGIWAGCKLLKTYKPDLVVGFGSYYSFPLLLAALMTRTPTILYAADFVPGKVIRWLSPYARATGLNFEEAARHIKGKSKTVGMPLRKMFTKEKPTKEEALKYFGLESGLATVVICGGSQGAQFLNDAAYELNPPPFPLQVIHLTGCDKATENLKAHYQKAGIKAAVKTFESRMERAWSAADLALARSGAVSQAEMVACHVPALLIPYPQAMDDHQYKNASFLEKKGICLQKREGEIRPGDIKMHLNEIWSTLESRQEKARALKEHHSKYTLKDLVMENLA